MGQNFSWLEKVDHELEQQRDNEQDDNEQEISEMQFEENAFKNWMQVILQVDQRSKQKHKNTIL